MKGTASYTATTTPNLATVHKFAEVNMTSLVLNYFDNRKTSEMYTEHETCVLYSTL
jgi:hypothetical protein